MIAKSASPSMVRQAPPELRCCTLTGRMVRSASLLVKMSRSGRYEVGQDLAIRAHDAAVFCPYPVDAVGVAEGEDLPRGAAPRSLCARPPRSQREAGPARRRFCGAGGTAFPARARAAGITTSAPSQVRTAKEVGSFSSRMPRTSAQALHDGIALHRLQRAEQPAAHRPALIGGESIHRVTAAASAAARPGIWPGGLHRAPTASAGCAAMRAP